MQIEKVEYKGWPNCYRLTNRQVELVATTDVGPRIIRFAFVGGENQFHEVPEHLGLVGGDAWRSYGGHRLWHAPEDTERTYFPDNTPITFEQDGEVARLVQPVEPTTGIQKEIELALAPDAAEVSVTHRLRNTNLWPVELAPWALSVMAPGGVAVAPLPPRGSHGEHLLPANNLALWTYTDMSDPRWTWGQKFILLRQDPSSASPQKVGVQVLQGWTAYARSGTLFVKRFQYQPAAHYPDLGSSVELFTNPKMLEVETLGPLTCLEPDETVEHVERWQLFAGVATPQGDEGVEAEILPRLS